MRGHARLGDSVKRSAWRARRAPGALDARPNQTQTQASTRAHVVLLARMFWGWEASGPVGHGGRCP